MLNKRYEQIELTNMCMIYDNEGNAVVQNKVGKSWGGITFPGGHIEKGESFVDSVIREIKEETGLDIKNLKLCGIKWWSVGAYKRYIVLLFKTNEYSGTLKLINLLTLGFEFYIIKKLICRRDGIGRRAGLKIQSWQQGAGSTPAAGTKGLSY